MTKLVPINAALAGQCANEGKRTGRGYYATVNHRLEQYSVARNWILYFFRKFPALLGDGLDVDPHDLTAWLNDHASDLCGALDIDGAKTLDVCEDCHAVISVLGTGEDAQNIDADRLGEILTAVKAQHDRGRTLHAQDPLRIFTPPNPAPCELCGSAVDDSRHEIIVIGG